MTLARLRNIRPRRAVPRRSTWETRCDPSWIESLLTESVRLNQTGRTFTRATSAWDPVHNCIAAPGVARQVYARYRDRVSIPLDLIEGAATNLLAAGSSEHFELSNRWSPTNVAVSAGASAPDGTATACTSVENSSTGNHRIAAASITKAGSAITYTISYHAKQSVGSRNTILEVYGAGNTNGAFVGVNLATGAINVAATAVGTATGVSAKVVAVGNGFWRIALTLTSDTTTSLLVYIDTANGTSASYAGDGVSANIYAWAVVEASAFPTSYISNRNLLIRSNILSAGAWGLFTGTVAQTASALPSGETGWTYTTVSGADNSFFQAFTVVPGQTYTASWWAKAGTSTVADYLFYDQTHSAAIGGLTSYFSQINGTTYTRVSFSVTAPAGCTTMRIYPLYIPSPASGKTMFIGDVQAEPGSTATAYWGTDATVGGRDAELTTMTYALGTGPGTIHALVVPYGWTTDQGGASFRIVQDSSLTAIRMERASSTTMKLRRLDAGGAEEVNPFTPALANGVLTSITMVWDSVSVRGYLNGALNGSPKTGLTPPYVTSTTLQTGAAGTEFYGWTALITETRAWTDLESKLVGQYAQLAIGQA